MFRPLLTSWGRRRGHGQPYGLYFLGDAEWESMFAQSAWNGGPWRLERCKLRQKLVGLAKGSKTSPVPCKLAQFGLRKVGLDVS